jgi:hypothetical protein
MARSRDAGDGESNRRAVTPDEIRAQVTETLATFRRYHRALPARDRWLFNLTAAGCGYALWLTVAFADPRLLLEVGVCLWAAHIARERRLNRGDDGHEHEDWLDY